MKLSTLIDKFLTWAEKPLAPATVAAYRHQLAKLNKHAGTKLITKLLPIHLTGYAKTWHEFQAAIRLMNWAVEEAKYLTSNPFGEVKLPVRGERIRVLNPADMVKFLRASTSPGRQYLTALIETLARPQEIRAACWEDLQSESPALQLDAALVQGKALIVLRDFKDRKKRKDSTRPRVLLVSKRLGRLLLRLRRRRTDLTGAIFLNTREKPWTSNGVRCLLRRLRERLGIEKDRFGETVVAYSFRHSMATLVSAWGIKDRMLADLLGHVETRTTARYQHLDVSHLRHALERLREQGRFAA
jgi:site-specific recombinase XerD